ncbi:hypothetical protein Tco_1501946 [Tanacetum coccineum]
MDDEPMWAADRVVAPTLGSAITIPETANEFDIKGSSNSNTDKIIARMDAMTMKMDAQYKEFQSPSKQPNPDHNDDDKPIGKSYDPPTNPNDQENDSETPINFDSEDEDEESTPQPKSQTPKQVKQMPIPKPYKTKIPYPQRLRKEKMEAQYGKFLNMI